MRCVVKTETTVVALRYTVCFIGVIFFDFFFFVVIFYRVRVSMMWYRVCIGRSPVCCFIVPVVGADVTGFP